MEELINLVQAADLKNDIPDFKAGDSINVHVRITEGTKERIQQFKGLVIQRRGTASTEMVTVRKVTNNKGVERIFPIHSPSIEKIEVTRRGRVRRARIYYMRNLFGKKARIKEAVENK